MARIWDVGRLALSGALVASTLLAAAMAQAPQFGTPEKKSWNPFKKDPSPKVPPPSAPHNDPNDPTSLNNKKKPDANFYATWGELEERGGRNAKALELYQRALKEDRRNLTALLGAARMKDASNEHDQALNYYRQAMRAHPNEAPVFNDLGLSYAKAEQYPQAIQAFQRAIQLDSERALYRNNLANVMIDAGQIDLALFQLQQAHGEALGHFNLGYLLSQKQRHAEAAECFARAGQLDPQLGMPPELQERLAMRPRAPESQPAPSGPQPTEQPPLVAVPQEVAAVEAPQPSLEFGSEVESAPLDAGQEVIASDTPVLDFGQQDAIETVEPGPSISDAAQPPLEMASPEAPLADPILPEANVELAPTEVAPSNAPVMTSPTFAEEETDPGQPLAPVVRAAPGLSGPEEAAPLGEPLSSRGGRPALPPRPSAVQLYREHASHSDQAPTPEAVFPPYDPTLPTENYAPLTQDAQQQPPHVGHRPQHGHQAPAKRSARTFKNPFSGWFGGQKKR